MNDWRELRQAIDSDSEDSYRHPAYDYNVNLANEPLFSGWQRYDTSNDAHWQDFGDQNGYDDDEDADDDYEHGEDADEGDDEYEDEHARHYHDNLDWSWIANDEASHLSENHFQQSFKFNECYHDHVFDDDDVFPEDNDEDWGETHADYGEYDDNAFYEPYDDY